jgi:hypothetical protein
MTPSWTPRFRVVLAVFVLMSVLIRPQGSAAQEPHEAGLVFDRYMSPVAGTADLLTIQGALASLEDRFLPLKLGDERRRLPLLAGVVYRAGKLIFLDVPQDHMLLVLGHEVFGHGARLRELGVGHLGYSFEGPLPYGPGGATTNFGGDLPDTPLTFLTISMAGIEAQNVMADAIAERALARGRWRYREAWLYFENRDLAMTYMLNATERAKEGNDIADYARTFKDACTPPGCTPIALSDIKRGALLTLGDPMLYYAMYGFASSYLAEGKATSPLPMIPLGHGLHVIPSLGFQLTPYGSEHLLRSAFISGVRPAKNDGRGARITTVALRVGDTGAASRPWALDAHVSDVRVFRSLHARMTASIWRQPPVLSAQTSAPLRTGAAGTATVALPLRAFTHIDWLHALITAGYKSGGFVPGEPLSGGIILRVGLSASQH